MESRREERHIAIIVATGILLLFLLITSSVVFNFQNMGMEEAKHTGQLELQVVHERLNSTFLQQAMFLRFFSTTVTRELEANGAIEFGDFLCYNNLLKQTTGCFSNMKIIPIQEISNILPSEFNQNENIFRPHETFFFGPHRSQNEDLLVTGLHTIFLHSSPSEKEILGYAVISYNFNQMLREAGVYNLLEDYIFSIRTKDYTGEYTHVFGKEDLFENDFLQMTFSFSLLNWELVLVPLSGGTKWTKITLLLLFVGTLIALLMAMTSYRLTKSLLFMRRQAYSDDMTGFFNKTEFMRLLRLEIAQCNKTDTRIALALLDIDNFKRINDRYGHTEGDRALLALVHKISQTVHRQDVLGRFGGDEFAILFRNMDTESAPYLAAKRVFRAIGKLEVEVGSEMVEIQTSMGVAIFGIDGVDAQTLIKQADIALYTAKKNGKNMLAFS